MKDKIRIRFPIRRLHTVSSDREGVSTIEHRDFLSMLAVLKATNVALREARIEMSDEIEYHGSNVIFDAVVEMEPDFGELSAASVANGRIQSIRRRILGFSAEVGVDDDARRVAKTAHAGSAQECTGEVSDKVASALSRCPEVIEIDGEDIEFGIRSSDSRSFMKPPCADLAYQFAGSERHAISASNVRISNFPEEVALDAPHGIAITLHVTEERTVRIADLPSNFNQLALPLDEQHDQQ